jgi:hypothetical protein
MFPSEVGRMVLDGVVEAIQYYEGEGDDDSLGESQIIYEEGFLGECKKAGDLCGLNKVANGTELKALVDGLLENLKQNPRLSPMTNTTFVTYSDVKDQLYSTFYTPKYWASLSNRLAEIIQGNYTRFITEWVEYGSGASGTGPQAQTAIAGGDAKLRREANWSSYEFEVRVADACRECNLTTN